MDDRAGRLLGGRYRLERLLAVGGMGEVWAGCDTVLQRSVAMKVPRTGLAADQDFVARFRSESLAVAPLSHPHIVSVYDWGTDDGAPFLVMELVDGEPLSAVIARHAPLDPGWVRDMVRDVGSALACAHDAGVVHRDIKPANLLVTADGAVKLTDFGIARAVDAAGTTQIGFVTGTVHYMSPERLQGDTAGPPADLYALGAVAYECLTARRLVDGSPAEIFNAHRNGTAAPVLPGGLPPGLGELVVGLVNPDPDRRPTAHQLAQPPQVTLSAGPASSRSDVASAQEPHLQQTQDLRLPAAGAAADIARRATATAWTAAHRRPLLAAASVVAVSLVAAVLALGGGSGGTGGVGGTPPAAAATVPARPVHLVSAALYHPGGSGSDHPADVPLAADGNLQTSWRTQHYASATFGNLRPGVGVVFDLGKPVAIRSLRLLLTTPGVDVMVYAGSSQADLLHINAVWSRRSAPVSLALTSGGSAARFWLVWFSRLPVGGGQAGIAEATFSS